MPLPTLPSSGSTNWYSHYSAIHTALNLVEGATDDQTGAEIKAAYEAESNTNAFTDAEKTKLGNAATRTTGTGAPATTPTVEGYIYVDTTGDNVWMAKGTASSADWVQVNGAAGAGTVDTSGTPVANDFARFTDADTIEGRSYSEVRTDLGLVIGTNVQAHSAVLDATTASFLTADETKLDGIEALADVTTSAKVSSAGAPIVSSGTVAPSSTPSKVGDFYVDTTAKLAYIATGTASSADWAVLNAPVVSKLEKQIVTQGTLTASYTGAVRVYFKRAATITNVMASVSTAPTGSGSIVADVNKNGTSIYPTSAKPTIALTQYVDLTSVPDTTSISAGDYLTVDVDAVGGTEPGADLVITVEYTETL